MKFLKKINKGLILTVIVLVALTIYLVNIEIQRKNDKPAIEQACKDYIEIVNKYATLPEENQKINEKISKEEREKYEKELKEKLDEKMIENEKAKELQLELIESSWEGETQEASILTKFDKKITKFKSFAFDGDQVTVKFTSTTNEEIKYLKDAEYNFETEKYEGTEELTKEESFKSSYDEVITLKKENNKWKVVYADLQLVDWNSMEYGTTVVF